MEHTDASIVKSIYGTAKIPSEAWIYYAQALLMVSGADGKVSEREMLWLEQDFARSIQAPSDFRFKLRNFKYTEASLASVLDEVGKRFPINYVRALIYDAIKMSSADRELHNKERDMARNAAEMLQVPIYIARTIEGLVNTERSVAEIRKSIFEVDDVASRAKLGNIPATNVLLMQAMFGLSKMSEQVHLNYGYALMTIAGADGEVSEAEKNWYMNEFAPTALTPVDTIYRVLHFDYKNGDLKKIVQGLQSEVSINFSKTLLYHAIQMARADGEYAEAERLHVEKTAQLLNIPVDIAQTIQYLADTEDRIAKMRRTMFMAQTV